MQMVLSSVVVSKKQTKKTFPDLGMLCHGSDGGTNTVFTRTRENVRVTTQADFQLLCIAVLAMGDHLGEFTFSFV